MRDLLAFVDWGTPVITQGEPYPTDYTPHAQRKPNPFATSRSFISHRNKEGSPLSPFLLGIVIREITSLFKKEKDRLST